MYDKGKKYTYEVHSKVPKYIVPVRMRTSPVAAVIAVILLAALAVGCGYLGAKIADKSTAGSENTSVVYIDSADRPAPLSLEGGELTLSGVIDVGKRSVVQVVTERIVCGADSNYVLSGAGSGVIFSSNGWIVTNFHVVKSANTVKVILYNGDQYDVVEMRGDEVSDIAILKINADTESCAVNVGNSSGLIQGQTVVSIGHPYHSVGAVATSGIVSAVNREVTIDGIDMNLVQHDADVGAGNSGGGLFNSFGALIGVVNAGSSSAGYAIPVNTVKKIATDLISLNYVDGRADSSILEFNEYSEITTSHSLIGLYIMKNNSGNMNFSLNDYIISVAGEEITTVAEWENIISKKVTGETIDIRVRRTDQTLATVQLTLKQKTACDIP